MQATNGSGYFTNRAASAGKTRLRRAGQIRGRDSMAPKKNAARAAQKSSCPLLDYCEKKRLEQYIPMTYKLAGLFPSDLLSFEEKRQIAFLGIARALESFERGKSEEAYWAYRKGYHAVEDAIRDEAKKRRRCSSAPETGLAFVPSRDQAVIDEQISREELERQKKQLRRVKRAIKTLPPRIREIVVRVGLNGETQSDVAKELGVTQGWISRLYSQGIELVREKVNPGE